MMCTIWAVENAAALQICTAQRMFGFNAFVLRLSIIVIKTMFETNNYLISACYYHPIVLERIG